MRTLASEVLTAINNRQGIIARTFLWAQARNRSTGVTETLGIWSGEDHQNFVIDGSTRTYYGAGAFIRFSSLKQDTSLFVRTFQATASPISPELNQLLRGYDPKFAPVEVHVGFFDTATNNLVAPPVRVFKGWINKFPLKTPKKNEQGAATIDMVGHTRLLTKTLAVKRSNESQAKRNASDTFFKDVGITGTIQTAWGSKTVTGASPTYSGGGMASGAINKLLAR